MKKKLKNSPSNHPKRILFSVLTLLIVFGAISSLYYLYYQEVSSSIPKNNNQFSNENKNSVFFYSLNVDYSGILPQVHFIIKTNVSLNAYSILLFANLSVKVKYYGDMVYVQGISGVIENLNKTNYYWFYYVNGKLGDVASNYKVLFNNTIVDWKYEPWQ